MSPKNGKNRKRNQVFYSEEGKRKVEDSRKLYEFDEDKKILRSVEIGTQMMFKNKQMKWKQIGERKINETCVCFSQSVPDE